MRNRIPLLILLVLAGAALVGTVTWVVVGGSGSPLDLAPRGVPSPGESSDPPSGLDAPAFEVPPASAGPSGVTRTITGTVLLSPSNRPVPGVSLGLREVTGEGAEREDIPPFLAAEESSTLPPLPVLGVSNRDGGFRIKADRPGQYRIEVIEGTHYLVACEPPLLDIGATSSITDVRLLVREGGVILGVVRDQAGAAVSAARVNCRPGIEGFLLASGSEPPRRDRLQPRETDEQGRFVFHGVPEGKGYLLGASARGYAKGRRERIDVVAGETGSEVEIVLARGASLAGRVLDAKQGPLPGAEILLYSGSFAELLRSGFDREETTSDDDGHFTLVGLGPGTKTLLVSDPLHAAFEKRGIEIEEGKAADAGDLVLDPGLAIQGSVQGANGEPIAGAEVVARSTRRERAMVQAGRRVAMTDGTGAFSIVGLEAGSYRVTAGKEGLAPSSPRAIAAGARDVVLELRATATLEGAVTAGDRPPPATFRIRLEPRRGLPFGFGRPPDGGEGSATSREFEDAGGVFILDSVTPGSYKVSASGPGFSPGEAVEVELLAGETTSGILVPLVASGSVSGIVRRSLDGAPVTEARVVRGQPPRGPAGMRPTSGALTDEEGRFHIEDLAPGPETLTATHPDHPPATLSSIEIPPGGEVTDLEILLLPAGGVEGFVYDASGAPQVGTFLGAGGSLFDIRRTTVTDEEGHYEIRGLAEGPCTVMKGSLGDAFLDGLASQTTDIRAGEMSRLDFGESKSGCRLHGRVLAREGPVPGATLTVTAEGSGGLPFLRSTTSGSAGTYSMEGIPPGKATLQVRTGGSGPAQGYVLSLEVPDEESFSLDVTLPEGGFSGTVRDADSGRPLSGIQIQVAVPEKERSSSLAGMAQRDLGRGVTDEQGKYAIVGLFPGTYDCTANGGETYGRLTVQGVQVPDGRMLDGVDFRLRTSGAIRGRATGPDGSPVARAYLHLRDSRGVELSGFTAFTAFTGEDGRFTVRNLAPDTYRVTALTRSLAPASREVEVWSDTESACELSLVEGGSLDLQVVGRAGNALSGAQADLLGSDGKSILVDRRLLFLFAGGSDRTGEDGTLLVEHVPAGHYTLVLEREGEKARERVEIQDGQTTTLRVRLDT